MNVALATAQLKGLPVSTYVSVLPWSSSEKENQRFKLIVGIILALTLMLALLVKWQELPETPRAEKEKIPPQLTRLLKPVKVEPPKPIIEPKPVPVIELPKIEPKPELIKKPPPKVVVPKEPVKVPEVPKVKVPTQAELTEQAKIKAKQSGILALQDDLASMRTNPSINNLANTDSIKGGGASDETQRKFVGKKVTGSSGGLDTSKLTTDTGSKGELAERKNTEYVAPTEGLASLAAQQTVLEDEVIGSRNIESIRQVLDANKGGIYAIYRRALRNDASLQGKLTVNLQIEADGSVSAIKLVFSELASPELEKDLLARISLINFGQQNVTQTLLDYSFNFLPF
ncbi:AgmX/PglI C-terminal domain-containing protein [Paraglaciecola hydrolytica]|uniref:Alcohol dehydrogenase n=1 Tax=Paraglaciecola hydrolytica TaxID=1799789 RepID=A0A136A1N9_9ALTE|nr:AgmX/PglI C-terminal domain-containing protein [Paraglaciecola hydrolytica]KXI29152.1 alcohol dehydrogenase [Paraglaciecola hydrolytica]